MSLKPLRSFVIMLAAPLAFLPAGAAGAAPPSPQPAAVDVKVSATGVRWEIVTQERAGVLTVAGPEGIVERREVTPGSAMAFSLYDAQGFLRPDGSYTWELVLAPEAPGTLGHVLSGSFLILSGFFVQPGETEHRGSPLPPGGRQATVAKDQAVADDVVVNGSLCVGLDCSNGESFGSDNVKLKANVLRLKFDDTSAGGGFPANDWQLTANDAGSSGLNKFSIEDVTGATVPFTIEAGAPNNSLYVNPSGKLGVGTSVPAANVHVVSGNTPSIRLEQNVSGGLSARTWDVAASDTAFAVKDVTAGTTPLQIQPGAPSSSIAIAATGNVGIGTANPTQELTVKSKAPNQNVIEVHRSQSDNQVIMRVFETSSGAGLMSFFDASGNEDFRLTGSGGMSWFAGTVGLNCNSPGGFDFSIKSGFNADTACNTGIRSQINAGATQFTVTSSRTIKENLQPIQVPGLLERIAAIGVYSYDFIDGPKDELGLMAEDFHTIFGRGSDKVINGQEIEMALWLAVQELTAENKGLRSQVADELLPKIEKQQELIQQLAERLARLEGKQ
jgi:hypothetical protein